MDDKGFVESGYLDENVAGTGGSTIRHAERW